MLKGRVLAAPMAGITDKVFRALLVEQGAALCYTEMVSAKALLFQNKKTHAIMNIAGEEATCGVQLFGAEAAEVARAAQLAVAAGARLVDINMGCPMHKIVNNGEGAALLRDIPRALLLAEEVVKAVPVPVTVKLRKGFDEDENGLTLARQLPEVGVAAITLHGRSRSQFYGGQADWDCIRRLKDSVTVPVIGNGDIFRAADGPRMLEETGCDAIMVGRGMLGNPWLLRDLCDVLADRRPQAPVAAATRIETAIRHLQAACALYGETMGVRHMRKFLGWYIRGFPGAAAARHTINGLAKQSEVEAFLRRYLITCEEKNAGWRLTNPSL